MSNPSNQLPEIIFRGMDRAALDAAYDNVAHVGQVKRDACVSDWRKRSEIMRRSRGARLDLRYGEGPRHRLDVFPCGTPAAPTLVYVHGGYWQWNDKERDAFIGEGVLAAGMNLVLVEYSLAPAVHMNEIVSEVRRSIAWTIDHVAEFDGDRSRVFVSGHSAGGHLAAMAMSERRLAGGIAISGIFDLEPIRLGRLNNPLALDREGAARNSPIWNLPSSSAPFVVAVGLDELPELVRQSEDYAAAWRRRGLPGRYLPVPKCDHFSILEELARPVGAILGALKEMALHA